VADEAHAQRFADAMDDDFNTPVAMAVLFELANEVNRSRSPAQARQLKALAGILGLLQRAGRVPARAAWQRRVAGRSRDRSLDRRAQGGQAGKNFAEADRIRAELTAPASFWKTNRAA
jgi:cysteinyl-tRNA synthetase